MKLRIVVAIEDYLSIEDKFNKKYLRLSKKKKKILIAVKQKIRFHGQNTSYLLNYFGFGIVHAT